ncbi:MAG: hypothetical protein ACYS7M_16285 [Planctomycetota bacterium]|jgi:hypothetical protein
MIGIVHCWCLGWAATLAVPVGQGPTSVPADRPGAASQPAPDAVFELSIAAYPPDVADERQYAHHIGQQLEALLTCAQQATDTARKVEYSLAAANWILAWQAEPQVSRLLLGIEQPSDLASVDRAVAEARRHLDAAGKLLADTAASGTASIEENAEKADSVDERKTPPSDQRGPLDKLETIGDDLAAFADALTLAWAQGAGQDDTQRVRAAASSLAVLLEDARPGVASAAMLYQALLYGRVGRMDRAMQVLDLALQPIPQAGDSFAFFSKLLRCRYLARQGGYAVAWSLLLRLEERCHDWFDSPQASEEAVRAVALVRLQVNESWRESLAASGDEERVAWCTRAEARIRETSLLADESPKVMRLGVAVPMLVDVADLLAPTRHPDNP